MLKSTSLYWIAIGTHPCEKENQSLILKNNEKKVKEPVHFSLDTMWEAQYYMYTTVVPCFCLPTSKMRTCIRPVLRSEPCQYIGLVSSDPYISKCGN